MTLTRRGLLAASAGAPLLPWGDALGQGAAPHGLRPGKPFAGTELAVLLPHASQFRAQQKRLPEFEALTGIRVTYSYVPFGQLREKITTEAVAGAGAFDVVNYLDSWGPAISQYLLPLDPLMARDGVTLDPYPPAYRQASRFEDRTIGLPIRAHPQLLFYRRDLLEKAGVRPPRTWEEVVTVGEAVQRTSPGTAGIAMMYGKGNGAQNLFHWLNFLWGQGGDVFDDRGAPRFNDATGVAATQAYLDLLLRHRVAAPGSVQFVEQDAVNSVAQGNSAMIAVWWWVYSVLTGAQSRITREQVGFAPMPSFAQGRAVSFAIALPFSISAQSRKQDAAWEFLKWVSNPDLQKAIVTDKSDPNTADIVATATAVLRDEEVNRVNGGLHAQAAQSLADSRIMPQSREWPQISDVLESTISELATGSKPVKAGLDEAARQVATIQRRAGRRQG